MDRSAEQIEILFEMAMAIGNSLELRPMLRKSLSTILKKLNCSAGGIHFSEEEDVAFQKEPIYSIPRDVSKNATYQLALEQLIGLVDAGGVANLASKLPLSGDGGNSSYYYLLELPNLGAVILVNHGQELDPLVVKSLDPLMRKLASACAACLQNEALQSVSARNQAILNGIPDMLFYIDRAGRMLDFQIGERYDVPARSLKRLRTNQRLDYFLGGEAVGRARQAIETALASGEIQVFEVEQRLRDYECRVVPSGPDEVLAIVRDITEAKRAGEALRESEERFRATFEQAAVGIAHLTPDGRFLRVNHKFCDIVGYSPDEMLARTFRDITHPDDLADDLAHMEQLLAGKTDTFSMDKRYLRKSSDFVWVTLTVTLVRQTTGEPDYFVSVVEDITDRKRAEESLQAVVQRTEGLYQASRSLVAIDDLLNLLQEFADDVSATLPADRVSVITFDRATETIAHFAKGGPGRAKIMEVPYDELRQGLAGWVLSEREPALSPKGIPDPRESPAVQQRRRETDAGSIVVVPIYYRDDMLGTITAINRQDQPDFTQDDVELIVTLANQAAVAITNARLLESLRERESRIQAIINTAPDGIVTIDEQGIVESFNPAAERLFGYRAGEIIGRNVNILMPSPHAEQHNQYLANYLETGQQKIIGIGREVVGRRKDGSLFPMYLAIGEVQLDNQRLFTGIIQDLSEVRQTEQTLSAVLNAVGEAIITIDDTGTIVMVNQEVQNIWGYSATELIGQSITNLMPERYRAPHRAGLERYLKTGEAHVLGQRIELEGLKQDGTTFPAETKISETRIGERLLFTAAVRDVTRRKELDKMRDDFVSTVSHELRTPLASIMGFVETILSGRPGPLTEIQQRFLQNSYKSSERLLKLIEELLTVSRIQRGTFQISKRLFLPSDAVQNVQEMVSNLAQAEAVALDITADWTTQQMLDGDQDRLEQVMTNLISNAIKFTPEGGRVTVQSRYEAGQWRFSVEDTGIGIPENDLPRLFDRFYRASNARESEIQGTGLGLYVCKAIVEQHGGQIGLDSQEGVGTTAWFTVPVTSEPVQELE